MVYVPGPVATVPTPPDARRFEAVVHVVGINPAVDFPADGWQAAGPVPVFAGFAGITVRATLVRTASGRRLYLNGAMRHAAGIEPGDLLQIAVWPDPTPRDAVAPADLRAALEAAGLWEAFLGWPPSHRREVITAVEDAKTEATRVRRIGRAIAHLRKGGLRT